MDDGALSAVIFANTPGDIVRIRDKVIDSLGRGIVPVPNIVRGDPEKCLSQWRHPAMICGVPIPEVTHRRMAIANVRRMWISKDSFHRPTIGSDDKVIAAQI